MKKLDIYVRIFVLCFAVFYLVGQVGADTYYFDGDGGTAWDSATNWSDNIVPTDIDVARIGTSHLSPATVDISVTNAHPKDIEMGFWHSYLGDAYTGILNVNNGGVLTVRRVTVGRDPGSTGIVNVAAGGLIMVDGAVASDAYFYCGDEGTTNNVSSVGPTQGVATAIINIEGMIDWSGGVRFIVGNTGPATVTVKGDAGLLTAKDVVIGMNADTPEGVMVVQDSGVVTTTNIYYNWVANTNHEQILRISGTNASVRVDNMLQLRSGDGTYEPYVDGDIDFKVKTVSINNHILTVRPFATDSLLNGSYTILSYTNLYGATLGASVIIDNVDPRGSWTLDLGSNANKRFTLTYKRATPPGAMISIL